MSYLKYQKKTIEFVNKTPLDHRLIDKIDRSYQNFESNLKQINKEFLDFVEQHFEIFRNEEKRKESNIIKELVINVEDFEMNFKSFNLDYDDHLWEFFEETVEYGIFLGDNRAKEYGKKLEINFSLINVGKDIYENTVKVSHMHKNKIMKIIQESGVSSDKGLKEAIRKITEDDEILDGIVKMYKDVKNISSEMSLSILCETFGIDSKILKEFIQTNVDKFNNNPDNYFKENGANLKEYLCK